ncbi:GNAT family N-acetyltransferase [Deinococcus lacus]|uniref:GNAT family N-acetyltransferase n=1 Tax=Deinococcus lacus TaxID=392561 RepID=A0ABW1YCA5_9DEIO
MQLTWTRGEWQVAADLLRAAANHLEAQGKEQLWPPEELTDTDLLARYPASGWRVAYRGGQAVGCFVTLDPDPLYWPEAPAGEALVMHKLAVHPKAQGKA